MSTKVPIRPINLIPTATSLESNKESKLKQLADAVQMYLNGEYSKLLSKDSNEAQTPFREEDENLGQLILNTIELNQKKQAESVVIVDNINEIEDPSPVQVPRHAGYNYDHRVTTVEEQQTQEDLEDNED